MNVYVTDNLVIGLDNFQFLRKIDVYLPSLASVYHYIYLRRKNLGLIHLSSEIRLRTAVVVANRRSTTKTRSCSWYSFRVRGVILNLIRTLQDKKFIALDNFDIFQKFNFEPYWQTLMG